MLLPLWEVINLQQGRPTINFELPAQGHIDTAPSDSMAFGIHTPAQLTVRQYRLASSLRAIGLTVPACEESVPSGFDCSTNFESTASHVGVHCFQLFPIHSNGSIPYLNRRIGVLCSIGYYPNGLPRKAAIAQAQRTLADVKTRRCKYALHFCI